MSILDCKSCGCKLHLGYDKKIVRKNDGGSMGFTNTPLLICSNCKSKYVPTITNELLNEACNVLAAANSKHAETEHDGQTADSQRSTFEWYDFNHITETYLDDKFISVQVKFLYDRDDYYFIPGLLRNHNIGFLTPVFFNIEVLLKYMHHPGYGLDIGADTFGYVYKDDVHYISFGINENNKVIMWLGDIAELPLEEQFYLRSENVKSDHSIGSEFYEAQIEIAWADAASEKALMRKRLEFNEKVRKNFRFSISQLDTETLRVAQKIQKLLINTEDAFKDLMIALNKLLVESINNAEIKSNLKEKFPNLRNVIKDKKGIKLLQLWLEQNSSGIDVNLEIAPLFVLYDLRLVSAHLYSDEKREDILNFCCERLGLEQSERDYITIANTLVEKLSAMYIRFNDGLEANLEDSDEQSGQ